MKAEKAAFRTNARKVGLVYSERFVYHSLFNGFAISIKTDQLSKLNRIPGVKNVYPVGTTPAPEIPLGSDPELFTSLAMIGADISQSELGYTGEGIKVGVIDTGIDYDHSDLGGDGTQRNNSSVFPTVRVAFGWDFVGDAYNADPASAAYNPIPTPDPYLMIVRVTGPTSLASSGRMGRW